MGLIKLIVAKQTGPEWMWSHQLLAEWIGLIGRRLAEVGLEGWVYRIVFCYLKNAIATKTTIFKTSLLSGRRPGYYLGSILGAKGIIFGQYLGVRTPQRATCGEQHAIANSKHLRANLSLILNQFSHTYH